MKYVQFLSGLRRFRICFLCKFAAIKGFPTFRFSSLTLANKFRDSDEFLK